MMTNMRNLSKAFLLVFILSLSGCATVNVPHYIQAQHPYERTYYGSFNDVLNAVRTTLKQEGWQIFKEVDPTMYERNPLHNPGDEQHILIFTEVKRTQRFVYTKSTHLNVYVSRIDGGVGVDMRYGSVKDFHLWKMRSYRNERLVKTILDRIGHKLLLNK